MHKKFNWDRTSASFLVMRLGAIPRSLPLLAFCFLSISGSDCSFFPSFLIVPLYFSGSNFSHNYKNSREGKFWRCWESAKEYEFQNKKEEEETNIKMTVQFSY